MWIKHLLPLAILLLTWSCRPNQPVDQTPQEWATAKVAVVLPLSGSDNDKIRYERITQFFEQQSNYRMLALQFLQELNRFY